MNGVALVFTVLLSTTATMFALGAVALFLDRLRRLSDEGGETQTTTAFVPLMSSGVSRRG